MSYEHYLQKIYLYTQNKPLTLNLFDSESNDIDIINRECYSRRLYLFVLLSSISMIIIDFIAAKEIKTVILSMSSQSEYEDLIEIDL